MISQEKIFRIKDNSIDLSRIKTIKLSKRYGNDKDKKRLIVIYNDRIEYIINSMSGENEVQPISDTIEILFDSEKSAADARNLLEEKWGLYVSK